MHRLLSLLLLLAASLTELRADVLRAAVTTPRPALSDCRQKITELRMINISGQHFFFSNESHKLSWSGAQSYCKSHGLELLSIEHTAKNNRIVAHILAIRPDDRYLNGMWTSGSRGADNHSWVWTGTGRPVEFSAWYDKHPLGGDKDRLAIAGWRTKVRWISLAAAEERRFICELPRTCPA